MAGDGAGKQNRQFIGAPVERFRHFSDLFLHLVAPHDRKIKPKPRHAIVGAKRRRAPSSSVGDDWRSTARSGESGPLALDASGPYHVIAVEALTLPKPARPR
jgi:hypothetical protein